MYNKCTLNANTNIVFIYTHFSFQLQHAQQMQRHTRPSTANMITAQTAPATAIEIMCSSFKVVLDSVVVATVESSSVESRWRNTEAVLSGFSNISARRLG